MILCSLQFCFLKIIADYHLASVLNCSLVECVKTDMKMCSLGSIDPPNREAWGLGVRHSSHLLPTPLPGTPAAVEK